MIYGFTLMMIKVIMIFITFKKIFFVSKIENLGSKIV
jgi:hypothetical protein